MEGVSIAVGGMTFVLYVASRDYDRGIGTMLIAYSSLAVGVIDVFHAVTYYGMHVIEGLPYDASTQLWVVGRLLSSSTLFAASFGAKTKRREPLLSTLSMLFAGCLLVWILGLRSFPTCYVSGLGLTPFKVVCEFLVTTLLLVTLMRLRKPSCTLPYRDVIIRSVALAACSELLFALYRDVYGSTAVVAHILRLASSYVLLDQMIIAGMTHAYRQVLRAYEQTVTGWSKALELKDQETRGHSERVTFMATRLALAVGMSAAEITHIRLGAQLHDLGKIGIPDAILLKPGPLTDEERTIMKEHVRLGYEVLKDIEYLGPALDVVLHHHEKWDGTGYPDGLKGDEIPIGARIFAIVDVWDALSSDRPYRRGETRSVVRTYLADQSGKHFDPKILECFLSLECTSPQSDIRCSP